MKALLSTVAVSGLVLTALPAGPRAAEGDRPSIAAETLLAATSESLQAPPDVPATAEPVIVPVPAPVPVAEEIKMPEPEMDPLPPAVQKAETAEAALAVPPPHYETPLLSGADEGGETLEDVLRWSYVNNPSLQSARASYRAVKEELPQAKAGWRPTVTGEASVLTEDIDAGIEADGTTSKDIGVDIDQPLYRGGRTVAAIGSAEKLILARHELLMSDTQGLMLSVATAFVDVLRDRALVELADNNKALIERQLQATKDRFQVGELTRTDVAQAEARLARAESDRIAAVGLLERSRAIYEQVIGRLPEKLSQPKINFNFPQTLDEALEISEKNNPEILAAAYLHESSQKDIDTVFGELLPEIGLTAGMGKTLDPQPGAREDTTTKLLGLTATIPIYQGGATVSRVRQAKHTANQRYLEILDSRRRIRQQTVTSWEGLDTARSEIKSRQSQVDATRTAQEGVRQEALLGSRTILDTLDANQEYLDAQVALVISRRNEVVAAYTLARMLGLLTPESLGFPEIQVESARFSGGRAAEAWGLGVDIDTETP